MLNEVDEELDECQLNSELKQCCCNCKFHFQDYFHCTVLPRPTREQKIAVGKEDSRCVCSVPKGYVCGLGIEDGRVHSNWPEHSCGCEGYIPKDEEEPLEIRI